MPTRLILDAHVASPQEHDDEFSTSVRAPRRSWRELEMTLSSVPPAPPPCSARLVSQRYELLDVLTHKGMGVVYRAIDRWIGAATLERIRTEPCSRRDRSMTAFEREYQVLSRPDHPRIIRGLDYGVDEKGPYYTMELVAGRDLSPLPYMPWSYVCLHLRDISSFLSRLHARRLHHRNLSLRNLKIDVRRSALPGLRRARDKIADARTAARLAGAFPHLRALGNSEDARC
jgi:serine/threonine protein kinase